jgi:TRAP-type C4-dicarboxylate transport system permease small subunit
MTALLLILCGVAYAALTLWGCGDYMSSTGHSKMPTWLRLLAMPGMLLVYGIALAVGFATKPFRRRR